MHKWCDYLNSNIGSVYEHVTRDDAVIILEAEY